MPICLNPSSAKAPKSKGRSPEPDDDELKEKKKRKSKSSTSATEFPLDILRKDLEQDGKPEEEVKPPEVSFSLIVSHFLNYRVNCQDA